jgi:hypothetical protein
MSHFLQYFTLSTGSCPGGSFILGTVPGSDHAALQCDSRDKKHKELKIMKQIVPKVFKGRPVKSWCFSCFSVYQ